MEDMPNDSVKYVYNMLTGRFDPMDDNTALREGAAQLYEVYKALVDGGFSETQAIQIVIGFLMTASKK